MQFQEASILPPTEGTVISCPAVFGVCLFMRGARNVGSQSGWKSNLGFCKTRKKEEKSIKLKLEFREGGVSLYGWGGGGGRRISWRNPLYGGGKKVISI